MTDEQTNNNEDRSAQVLNELANCRGVPPHLYRQIVELAEMAQKYEKILASKRKTWHSRGTRTSWNQLELARTNSNQLEPGYIYKKDTNTKESKKVSKILIPELWKPSDNHYQLGLEKGLARDEVDDAAAEMRAWSLGNGERRTNWDWVFNNWLRRNAQRKGRNGNGTHRQPSKWEKALNRLGDYVDEAREGGGVRQEALGFLPESKG